METIEVLLLMRAIQLGGGRDDRHNTVQACFRLAEILDGCEIGEVFQALNMTSLPAADQLAMANFLQVVMNKPGGPMSEDWLLTGADSGVA